MSAEPTRMEWEVGRDIHGRLVKLVFQRNSGGRLHYTLDREAANQPDERVILDGLTREHLLELGRIAEAWRHG